MEHSLVQLLQMKPEYSLWPTALKFWYAVAVPNYSSTFVCMYCYLPAEMLLHTQVIIPDFVCHICASSMVGTSFSYNLLGIRLQYFSYPLPIICMFVFLAAQRATLLVGLMEI